MTRFGNHLFGFRHHILHLAPLECPDINVLSTESTPRKRIRDRGTAAGHDHAAPNLVSLPPKALNTRRWVSAKIEEDPLLLGRGILAGERVLQPQALGQEGEKRFVLPFQGRTVWLRTALPSVRNPLNRISSLRVINTFRLDEAAQSEVRPDASGAPAADCKLLIAFASSCWGSRWRFFFPWKEDHATSPYITLNVRWGDVVSCDMSSHVTAIVHPCRAKPCQTPDPTSLSHAKIFRANLLEAWGLMLWQKYPRDIVLENLPLKTSHQTQILSKRPSFFKKLYDFPDHLGVCCYHLLPLEWTEALKVFVFNFGIQIRYWNAALFVKAGLQNPSPLDERVFFDFLLYEVDLWRNDIGKFRSRRWKEVLNIIMRLFIFAGYMINIYKYKCSKMTINY